MFDIPFALDGLVSGFINFEMHEPINPVALRVAVDQFVFMLVDTTNEIIRYANIQSAPRTTCENVNAELPHA